MIKLTFILWVNQKTTLTTSFQIATSWNPCSQRIGPTVIKFEKVTDLRNTRKVDI